MISVTNDFKTQTRAVPKQWHAYVNDFPGELYADQITDEDDLKSLKITVESSILRTVMRTAEVRYFGTHDYLDKYVNIGIGLVLPDTTTEYIDYGQFKVILPIEFDKGTNITKIKLVDKMYEALQLYDIEQLYDLPTPYTLSDLLQAICTRLGWELATGSDTFPNSDVEYNVDPVAGLNYTFRQVLDWIAEMGASIIYFDVDNKLTVKQIAHDTPLEELDQDILQTLKIDEKWGEINSVVISEQPQEDNIVRKDDTSIAANGLTEIKIKNNLLAGITDEEAEARIEPIFDELFHLEFYPFTATNNGMAYFQIGDRIEVTDPNSVTREVVIFGITIDMTGGIKETIKCGIPDKNSTNYNTAGIIGLQIRDTQIIVNKQTGQITIITQNLNEAVSQINLSIDSITASVNQAINQGDVNADAIDDLQENLAELTLTAEALELAVAGIGGTNLLKNSVGLKGTIAEWQELDSEGTPIDADNNGSIDQSTDVINNSESGSALVIEEQFLKQNFATIEGEAYTIYFRYKSIEDAILKVTGLSDITLPEAADWTVFKRQFTGSASTTSVEFDNTTNGTGATLTFTDNIVKLGDANGWSQAPNEVYGANYRFDKDGFLLSDPNSKFKALLTNEALTVFDTSTGSDRIVMQVSKDLGKILRLVAEETLTVQREGNSAAALRVIAVDDGVFEIIND